MKIWYVTFTGDCLCDLPCNTKWHMMVSSLAIQWLHMLCEPMMNSYRIRFLVYVRTFIPTLHEFHVIMCPCNMHPKQKVRTRETTWCVPWFHFTMHTKLKYLSCMETPIICVKAKFDPMRSYVMGTWIENDWFMDFFNTLNILKNHVLLKTLSSFACTSLYQLVPPHSRLLLHIVVKRCQYLHLHKYLQLTRSLQEN
jgi:hypothetical protein